MDEDHVVYAHNGILFTPQKGNSPIFNMENLGDIILSDVSKTEGQILHNAIYIKYLTWSKRNSRMVVAKGYGEGEIGCS